MSMRMTREDLSDLITMMDALESVPAEIKTVRIGSHEVYLHKIEDSNKRSGVSYIVRGITDKVSSEPVYRDGGPVNAPLRR